MAKNKKRFSLSSKILLIIECGAVILLLLLCGQKNKLPGVTEIVSESKPDIVLDAGHGGFDAGAINGDVYEKDITLAMTKDIGEVIEQAGYRVLYTRNSDEVNWADEEIKDLAYRTKVSNKSGAKLFLSIHVNSEEYAMESYGYEAWVNVKDATAVKLAESILQEVEPLDFSQNRGIQNQNQSPLYVISRNHVPAVLFEVGFIGSSNDQLYLLDDTYRKQFTDRMAQGIITTLANMK